MQCLNCGSANVTDPLGLRSSGNFLLQVTTWEGQRKPMGGTHSDLAGRACRDCGYLAVFVTDPAALK